MKKMKKLILKMLNRSILKLDKFLVKKNKEAVNHPAHYNQEGRKECIDEMIDKFGTEAVRTFCLLNAYKHEYRHEMKGGQEDIAKAEWYMRKYEALGGDPVE